MLRRACRSALPQTASGRRSDCPPSSPHHRLLTLPRCGWQVHDGSGDSVLFADGLVIPTTADKPLQRAGIGARASSLLRLSPRVAPSRPSPFGRAGAPKPLLSGATAGALGGGGMGAMGGGLGGGGAGGMMGAGGVVNGGAMGGGGGGPAALALVMNKLQAVSHPLSSYTPLLPRSCTAPCPSLWCFLPPDLAPPAGPPSRCTRRC